MYFVRNDKNKGDQSINHVLLILAAIHHSVLISSQCFPAEVDASYIMSPDSASFSKADYSVVGNHSMHS